jgi:membrane fusion protein
VSPDSQGSGLFRREAMQHGEVRQLGTVVLAKSLTTTLIVAFFVMVVGCVIAFMVFFSHARKAHVSGVLVPSGGLVRVLASQAGVVTEVRVREGQAVTQGEELFVISSERQSLGPSSAEATVASLLQVRRASLIADEQNAKRVLEQRRQNALRRVDDLSVDVRRVGEQIQLQQRRAELAEAAWRRHADLETARFVSNAQVQDRHAEWLDQLQRLKDLQRAQSAATRDMLAARAELRDLGPQGQREQSAQERSVATIDQEIAELEARRRQLVRAPHDAIVSGIVAEAGQAVAANSPLAVLVAPGSDLEAELYVPSRSAGFVTVGAQVLLRYQSYPYQKFGQAEGTVHEVSATALRREDLGAIPASAAGMATAEPVYRVRVRLARQAIRVYGQDHLLKPGMLVDASLVLERRRIYEWALEPLMTIAGQV